MRKCGVCGGVGHNSRTCKLKQLVKEPLPEGKRETLQAIGRAIIEQQNQVVERIPDDLGTIPKTGLWIINLDRKRIAGKISQVKKTGEILWTDCYNCPIESDPKIILAAGYRYLDLEAHHLLFEITAKGKINVSS